MQLIRERLETLAGRKLDDLFQSAEANSIDQAQALTVLTNLYDDIDCLVQLEQNPELSKWVFEIIGSHPAIAGSLNRDPESISKLVDPRKRRDALTLERLLNDCRQVFFDAESRASGRPFKFTRLAMVVLDAKAGAGESITNQRLADLSFALTSVLAERGWREMGEASTVPDILSPRFTIASQRELTLCERVIEGLTDLEDSRSHRQQSPEGRVLDSILGEIRRKIQGLPASIPGLETRHPDPRTELLKRLGTSATVASDWLDAFPVEAGLYAVVVRDDDAFQSLNTILRDGPQLIETLKKSLSLTKFILTSKAPDRLYEDSQLRELPVSCSLDELAQRFCTGWCGACAAWLLDPKFDLGEALSDLMDALLVHCAHRLYLDFDIVALGSYGRRELAPGSDADVLFLIQDSRQKEQALHQASDLLVLAAKLRRSGAPVTLDLRMRRDGAPDLVHTYAEFMRYELEEMQIWQRFELGMSRGIIGSEHAASIATKAAYAQPLTPQRLKELLAMKRRIETSELKPQYRGRDIKFGEGALGDLEWFVHILEMRYPTATHAGEHLQMADRIRALGRARLINAVEVHELLAAREHLLELRNRLELLGIEGDVLPENPGRLEALAVKLDAADANDLLLRHERLTKTVRAIFTEGMEGLKI